MQPGRSLPLIDRAFEHGERTAVIGPERRLAYHQLLAESAAAASVLLQGREDLDEARVGFLVPPGAGYVVTQWAIWRAGGIAVPLAVGHPRGELEHVIRDAECELLVAAPELLARLRGFEGPRLLGTGDLAGGPGSALPEVAAGRRAMILYTSGTTGRPKGVVTTHEQLRAQVETLVEAWGWRADDRILGVLALHHVHGIVNVLTCALWGGASCELMAGFDANAIWDRLAGGETSLFMAVPTIYRRLIDAWERSGEDRRRRLSAGSRGLRLMVSGSAALPVATLERWRQITGHTLLERYGMTEIGMALSNPLAGPRVPGTVGVPLPGVEVRIVGETGVPMPPGEPGEIEVRGPGVFVEYWRRPQATLEAFRDGWFRTGDRAVCELGCYRLLGRLSVDIIKSGGEKVSALEIEECLRQHPQVDDCAVVGVDDPEWGQRVVVAVVPGGDGCLDPAELRGWARRRLAPAKVPREILAVSALPRNTLGKVFKPDVQRLFVP